jgi:succinate dehydrogenase hydrophobic anchor subunit
MEDGKYGKFKSFYVVENLANEYTVEGSLWFYAPNKAAPVVWAFLFLVSGLWHAWQCMLVVFDTSHGMLLTIKQTLQILESVGGFALVSYPLCSWLHPSRNRSFQLQQHQYLHC